MPDYAVNQDVINKAKDLIQSGWCQAVFGLLGVRLSWTVWCQAVLDCLVSGCLRTVWCQAVFGLLGVRPSLGCLVSGCLWTAWCQAVVQVMWDAIISLYNHC